MRATLRLAFAGLFVLCSAAPLWAFKLPTHTELNGRAADYWDVQGYLRSELGLQGGVETRIRDRIIRDWIQEGGAAEDKYLGDETMGALNRSKHHFHNPQRPWASAGLSARCFGVVAIEGRTSARWAQDPDQLALSGETATWADARKQFWRMLTLSSKGSGEENRDKDTVDLFRILGQHMHLIADLAVPAHTRDDVHCTERAEPFEVWSSQRAALSRIASIPVGGIVKPAASIFSVALPTGESVATVPVARLWDSDQYEGPAPDPNVTLRPTIGLAEFTNANFFSRDTVFSPALPFPARSSVDLLPEPQVVPSTGQRRRYLTKTRDGVTVPRIAVPSSLYDFTADALKDRKIWLDDNVLSDYATLLFPRAVGYSAALLDYFFRGTLDVGLADDEAVPRMIGSNTSSETLGPGQLFVFAEDGSGVRRLASNADGIAVGSVAPGGDLPEVPLTVPERTERLVAAYRGRLGNEIPAPASDFPGAVIGKVFSGVRVEEIFAGATHWQVRTPRGVFTLPLTRAEYRQVKWADTPDTIVARTPVSGEASGRVVAFEVDRAANGVDLLAVGDPPMLRVTEIASADFPFAAPPLVTTIDFNQTVQYRQQVGRFTLTHVLEWAPRAPFGPNDGTYELVARDVGPVTFETIHQETVPFSTTIPIRLDREHNLDFGSTDEGYVWQLADIAADRQGRVLGVIVVFPTLQPPIPPATVPFFVLDSDFAPVEIRERIAIEPLLPFELAAIWAIVDLRTGTVLASTAEPNVTVTSTRAAAGPPWDAAGATPAPLTFYGLYRHQIDQLNGGPSAGTFHLKTPFLFTPRTELPAASVAVEAREGDQQLAVAGWMRPDLTAELDRFRLLNFQAGEVQRLTGHYNYECVTQPCSADGDFASFSAVTVRGGLVQPPARFLGALRARPAPAGERLVLLGDAERGGFPDNGYVVVWDPDARRATMRLEVPRSFHGIAHATSSTVMLWNQPVGVSGEPGSYVVSLDDTRAPTFFPGTDLRFDFTLLDPRYLYSVDDLKFYRLAPPLQRTPLPAALSDAAGNPRGDYHVITLR